MISLSEAATLGLPALEIRLLLAFPDCFSPSNAALSIAGEAGEGAVPSAAFAPSLATGSTAFVDIW